MLVVIDTNVLVSALWSRDSNPGKILDMLLSGEIKSCFDHRILIEYEQVLSRPRFSFSKYEIMSVLGIFEEFGFSIVPKQIAMTFTDESDKKFYEIAKHCNAILITGNKKHFPKESGIISPAEFLKTFR